MFDFQIYQIIDKHYPLVMILDKQATQSSDFNSKWTADLAVNWDNNDFANNAEECWPYWMVDLETMCDVEAVIVHNQMDCE